ncbi:hypothetical protein [Neobacillus niacini]|nr:hypothetical protein [Neobacillus niacini]
MLIEVNHPVAGTMKIPGNPVKCGKNPKQPLQSKNH